MGRVLDERRVKANGVQIGCGRDPLVRPMEETDTFRWKPDRHQSIVYLPEIPYL